MKEGEEEEEKVCAEVSVRKRSVFPAVPIVTPLLSLFTERFLQRPFSLKH